MRWAVARAWQSEKGNRRRWHRWRKRRRSNRAIRILYDREGEAEIGAKKGLSMQCYDHNLIIWRHLTRSDKSTDARLTPSFSRDDFCLKLSSHITLLYDIIFYYIKSCHIVAHRIMSCHIMQSNSLLYICIFPFCADAIRRIFRCYFPWGGSIYLGSVQGWRT